MTDVRNQVHLNHQISYYFNCQPNYPTFELIIYMQTVVGFKCGNTAYGHDHRTKDGGAPDLSVGRTYCSDYFCEFKAINLSLLISIPYITSSATVL
ncbi:hypothetical protein K504DRAFT_468285 [Pleomassaria siparia CBS 279.74]|uniref:Uncharacterized protein n=1 Tax=Pleomassaria siparia CBS 279.74 TaxID=1314801 RepID=A0A6G1K957_9PLEO|nr:hypothetical protein K504DRAFT_468285 [Pleomassaria siparia CBS 279.74]